MTLLVSSHDIAVLNRLMLIIPMIVLVRRRLETLVGCQVYLSIWWHEFRRVIPFEKPELERSASEEREVPEDPPVRSSCKGKGQDTSNPARADTRIEAPKRAVEEYV